MRWRGCTDKTLWLGEAVRSEIHERKRLIEEMAGNLNEGEDFKFADLNIIHDPKDPKTTVEMVRQAIRLGYDAVAINIDIGEVTSFSEIGENTDEGEPAKKRKKKAQKGKKMKTIPEPFKVDASQLDVRSLQAEGRKFRQFSRITASLTDSGHVHNLTKNADVRKFDLIAVRPNSEQILASVATKTDVDLICFDPSQQVPWLYKGKLVQLAVDRGIGFEICYAPALSDSSMRRSVFGKAVWEGNECIACETVSVRRGLFQWHCEMSQRKTE